MQHNPAVPVQVDELKTLPVTHSMAIRETDPSSGKYCEARFAAHEIGRWRIQLRDWAGDVFLLEVDMESSTAWLPGRRCEPSSSTVFLTKCIFDRSVQLLSRQSTLGDRPTST